MGKDDVGYEDMVKFKVKNAIVAPEGWSLLAADQSQIELRVAGCLSNDPDMIMSYKNDIDMHSLNAKVCANIKIDLTDIKKEVEVLGYKPGTEKYDIEVLRRELKVIKRDYGPDRTAAKSVS